jgi:hypothetical protein
VGVLGERASPGERLAHRASRAEGGSTGGIDIDAGPESEDAAGDRAADHQRTELIGEQHGAVLVVGPFLNGTGREETGSAAAPTTVSSVWCRFLDTSSRGAGRVRQAAVVLVVLRGADGAVTPPTALGTRSSPITGTARKPSAPA